MRKKAVMMGAGLLRGGGAAKYWNPIFVRKTGNDTTGDGSYLNPYLTINKAYAVAPSTGCTIVVGDGVYAENSGAGCLSLTRTLLTDWVTIAPERGAGGDVTITNASGSSTILIAAKYVRFKWIKFVGGAGTSTTFRINGASSYIDAQNCTITPATNATAGVYIVQASGVTQLVSFTNCTINKPAVGASCDAIQLSESGTADLKNIRFDGCTIAANRYGLSMTGTGAGISLTGCTIAAGGVGVMVPLGSIDALSMTSCAVTSTGGEAVKIGAAGSLAFNACAFENTSAHTTLFFGADAESGGGPVTVAVSGGTVKHATGQTGHSVLLGNGCTNCVIDGLKVLQSYDHGLCIKEHAGSEVKNCDISAGAGTDGTALYVKGATGANAHHNILRAGRGVAFKAWNGDTANKVQNVTATDNEMILTGAAVALSWVGDAGDLGGGVCDRNIYRLQGTGKLGAVRGDADVQTIAELRAAWAGYGAGTNDANSTVSS